MPSDALKNVVVRLEAECMKGNKRRAALRGALTQDAARQQLAAQIALEFLFRKKIDAACRTWMKTGKWPIAEHPDTSLFYWNRVWEAMMLAGWLHTSGFSSEKTEDELLQFFLIDSWEVFGLRRLQARLEHGPV